MANKRMFTMKIVDSDAFLEMPLSTQCLYFHLNMRADDDGFIGNPKKIMKIIGASADDLKLLIAKRFVIAFEDGVIVIKHWRMHNTLSQNRYHETQYTDEKSFLKLKDNGSYSLNSGDPIDDSRLIGAKNGKKDQSGLQADAADFYNHEEEQNNADPLDAFFESIWKLYPIKRGKGAVSKTKKQVLQRIGYEEIKRCVERFISDMEREGRDKNFWMHGSTFFNSGYVDYLDKNYCSGTQKESAPEIQEQEDFVEGDWFDPNITIWGNGETDENETL